MDPREKDLLPRCSEPSHVKCSFYRDVFGSWRWECVEANGDMRDSVYSSTSLADCVADAISAGVHLSDQEIDAALTCDSRPDAAPEPGRESASDAG